jgi:HSP20 family protein
MERENQKNRQEGQAIEQRQREGHVSNWDQWPTRSPFGMMRRWFDDMDRMFEGFGFPVSQRFGAWMQPEGFSPRLDIVERDGKLVITADLPGMEKDDIKVNISDDSVLIEGERKYEHEDRKEGVYHSERSHGQFRRQVSLPQGVRTESAKATFKNGVLEIVMDSPGPAQNTRRIEIQDEGAGPRGQRVA